MVLALVQELGLGWDPGMALALVQVLALVLVLVLVLALVLGLVQALVQELVQVLVQELVLESVLELSLIHISEPTRRRGISYAVFCLKKKRS